MIGTARRREGAEPTEDVDAAVDADGADVRDAGTDAATEAAADRAAVGAEERAEEGPDFGADEEALELRARRVT